MTLRPNGKCASEKRENIQRKNCCTFGTAWCELNAACSPLGIPRPNRRLSTGLSSALKPCMCIIRILCVRAPITILHCMPPTPFFLSFHRALCLVASFFYLFILKFSLSLYISFSFSPDPFFLPFRSTHYCGIYVFSRLIDSSHTNRDFSTCAQRISNRA